MQIDPGKRFQSASEMKEAFKSCFPELVAGEKPNDAREMENSPLKRQLGEKYFFGFRKFCKKAYDAGMEKFEWDEEGYQKIIDSVWPKEKHLTLKTEEGKVMKVKKLVRKKKVLG